MLQEIGVHITFEYIMVFIMFIICSMFPFVVIHLGYHLSALKKYDDPKEASRKADEKINDNIHWIFIGLFVLSLLFTHFTLSLADSGMNLNEAYNKGQQDALEGNIQLKKQITTDTVVVNDTTWIQYKNTNKFE